MKIETTKGFEDSMKRIFSNNPIYSIPRWFREKKYIIIHAWQRVFRGYDDSFVYDFNTNMTELVINCLTDLKKNHCGYPGIFNNSKEWDEILKQIIDGFKLHRKINFYPEKYFKYNKNGKIGNYKVGKRKRDKDYKKFEKSMSLFTKYYSNLWD